MRVHSVKQSIILKTLFLLAISMVMEVNSLQAQKIQQGKIVWLLGSGNGGDSRVSYTFVSTGLIGGTGIGYTGIESVELLLRNNTSHKLLVKVSYALTNTCNEIKTFTKTESIEPNESTKSKGAFNTGIDYSTNCKSFKKIEEKVTVIKSVNVELISIEDITEKESIVKRSAIQAEKEKKRNSEENETVARKSQEATKTGLERLQSPSSSKGTTSQIRSQTKEEVKQPATQAQTKQVNSASNTTDADARYQEQLRIFNQTMKDADDKRKADAQQSQLFAEGITQFAGGVIANIRADAERKALNDEKRRDGIKRNREKGYLLLENFLSNAEEGNEDAIKKVEQAYSLIEMPYLHFNEIGRDGFYSTYEPKKYVDFLTRMYNNHQSSTAQKALVAYYSSEVKAFQQVVKDHKRKAIVRPLLAGIVAAGGLIGGSKLMEQETRNEIESGKVGPSITPGAIVQSVGVLGGATLFLSGVVHLVRIGQTNRDENFISSKSKLGKVQARERLSFSPMYDLRNANWGLSLRLHF